MNTDTTDYTFLVNRDYPLGAGYAPADLVAPDIPFSCGDVNIDKRKLSKVAADALEELYQAALAEEGLSIYGVSGYRSYDRQYEIYGTSLLGYGTRHTNLYSAAPGNSEHQTGLAIDVSCKSINYALDERFATTSEGIWLKDNCWRFGFILRYPKDKETITGYAYEPWHIRYVGVPLAYYLHTTGLTLDEYYGSPSSHTLEELKDKPLIDMNSERFYKLYASYYGSEMYRNADGSVMVSASTGYPVLKKKITDQYGNVIKVNGRAFYLEPVYDSYGNLILDSTGQICYTRPYFDASGNLWLNRDNTPVFLPPLWNGNGTLATDSQGNLLYTDVVKDGNGNEYITPEGDLLFKVPVRIYGELSYLADGSVAFYEPFINPVTGELILDSSTGLPMFPAEYDAIPHNTLPLPEEYWYVTPEETTPEIPEIPEEPWYDDSFPDEDTSGEEDGFVEEDDTPEDYFDFENEDIWEDDQEFQDDPEYPDSWNSEY
ncbi:MAG: M15 family metallopeptidase [Lachnospiraceae bacterium]|nr:M15 family metallopeptidase [Lachnospiraceae bacterium]